VTSTSWEVNFSESVAQTRPESMALAHLSIELGHLYFEEFKQGEAALSTHFERIAPWVRAVRDDCGRRTPSGRPRISTCFLVDDYFTRFSSPAVVLPQLITAAAAHDLVIDYVARESACAAADGVQIAELVLGRLVPDPVPGANGIRPPATVSGWLCNGSRSPDTGSGQAMSASRHWEPPAENGANNHSIFLDVELWDEPDRGPGQRRWSCPYLAAVWQLLRLGLLRNQGAAVAAPVAVETFPDEWDRLPPVVRVNPQAQPFGAYRTFSLLGARFLPIEHAVRTILSQFAVEEQVFDQVRQRASAEGIDLGEELWQRVDYLFVAG
jgi:hypothetical protein